MTEGSDESDVESWPETWPDREALESIARYRELFERPGFEFAADEDCSGYPAYAEEVEDFLRLLYDRGFIVRFDWPAWHDAAKKLWDDPEALTRSDLPTLCRLITYHVRKERFCAGHLRAVFETGHLLAILRRLDALM